MRMLPLLGFVAFASCHVGDPFLPSPENMSGAYTATQLITVDPNGPVDWLKAGASLHITLTLDGKTSGRLFMPGAAPGGGDLDEDMAGTWLVYGYTLQIAQAAPTFIRNIDFIAEENRIAGDQYFGDTLRVIIILTK